MLHNSQNLFTLEDFYDLNSEKKGKTRGGFPGENQVF